MSEDIDPFKEPPVYKYDQILTMEDMLTLRKHYWEMEKILFAQKDPQSSMRACMGHLAIEEIIGWLETGKPTLSTEGKDDDTE